MTRDEYLKELKSSIMSLSEDEQAEAIQYYSDYFDEAQDDEKVMKELGTPSELADTIIEKFANALVDTKSKKNKEDDDEETAGEHTEAVIDALYYEFDKNKIHNISMDFGAAEVVLIKGNVFSVETRGIARENMSCYLNKEGTLVLSNSRRFNINFWGHDRRIRFVPRILVTLPENLSIQKLRILMGAGKLSSEDISLLCESGSLDVGAGNMVLKGIYGGRIDIRCGMGNLQLDGKITGNVNLDCGMGNISLNLEGNISQYSYDAKVRLGDFRFNNDKMSGVCQNYNNERKENHFSVNCGMGSVVINIK